MANTYLPGSGLSRDRVRLLLGDTSATVFVFEDAELDEFLAMNSSDVLMAAALGIRVLSVNAGKRELWYQVTGLLVDRRGSTRALLAVAEAMEKQALQVPWEFESTLEHCITSTGVDRSQYAMGPWW